MNEPKQFNAGQIAHGDTSPCIDPEDQIAERIRNLMQPLPEATK